MLISVFSNVIVMMFYMAIGFALCKSKLGTPSHAKTMSGLLIYVLGPAMIINAFLTTPYSLRTLMDIGGFFLATLIIQTLFFTVLFIIFHTRYKDGKYRIMTMASVLGNVGFFGLPLLTGMFPDIPIGACYSSVHVMSLNILVFTVGKYLITNDRKYISVKSAILNPTTIAIVVALPLFILKVKLPTAFMTPIGLLGKMVTPVCMIILGMRLSTVPFKKLFSSKVVYFACVLKLIIYPVFAFLCVHFIPALPDIFKISVVALASAPAGAIIESLAELHECEQEISANMVLLTTMLSVITIPVMLTILL